ncbi:MAG: Sulfopyruvate decarboxylase - alpha subunit [uncultured Ramlibacter sp.]|uniref:Sulfopyruvate decarboxylase - alpha subunit n=1 Tax=uncultured Ramlibacter sp. TaxID=260755 RepID=A0A6J4NVP5_9BURK|nr:MAG: Sulfopyruvate decarboxylase - alpha subunit [uncultured Ramlibacter sp.]
MQQRTTLDMRSVGEPPGDAASTDWPGRIHAVLQGLAIRQVAYVPDAGHSRLIQLCEQDGGMVTTVLTTEEEGIALAAGAWLGGQRGVVLMQSSGVGNCINMLSLVQACRVPLAMIVTMRGEWGEFNPWQIPMGSTTCQSLELAGVNTCRVEREQDAAETVEVAVGAAMDTQTAVAVVLSQRMLGRKKWTK